MSLRKRGKSNYKNKYLIELQDCMEVRRDDILDSYYFTRDKCYLIKPFADEYPSVFTLKKKVPLNFQLRMDELTQASNNRKYSEGESQFRENMLHKLDLRRRYMKHVLETRDDHLVFDDLCSEEEVNDQIWYYIDHERAIVGPLTCSQMQDLWEQKQLKPDTYAKKKMVPEFVQACHLLNKYCRVKLQQTNSKNIPIHFSSPASKQVTEAEGMKEIALWLRVVGM